MHPDLPLYNIFLNGCVKSQNFANASNCLKEMDEQLIGKSEITYWELLKVRRKRLLNYIFLQSFYRDSNLV